MTNITFEKAVFDFINGGRSDRTDSEKSTDREYRIKMLSIKCCVAKSTVVRWSEGKATPGPHVQGRWMSLMIDLDEALHNEGK